MFKLNLKGFKPLKDLEITAQDNILVVTGDDGIGADYFISIIRYLGVLLTGADTGNLHFLLSAWLLKDPRTLEFSMCLDSFEYHVRLKRRTHDYKVELEEMLSDGEILFTHSGTICSKSKEAPDNQLYWKRIRYSDTDFPLLESMQNYDLLNFICAPAWPLDPEHDYWRTSKLCAEECRHKKGYISTMNKYLSLLTEDYSQLKRYEQNDKDYYVLKENESGDKPLRYSYKMNCIINLLFGLQHGIKVVWHPESYINPSKINNFYNIIKKFAVNKPIFVVTDDSRFMDGKSVITLENNKKVINCTQLN